MSEITPVAELESKIADLAIEEEQTEEEGLTLRALVSSKEAGQSNNFAFAIPVFG